MDESSATSSPDRKQLLFLSLIMTYQNLALQALGKIVDPTTGEVHRDMESARFAIDILDMLHDKCRGNLTSDEERLLNQTLADLKLNFVEEATKGDSTIPSSSPPQSSEAHLNPSDQTTLSH